MIRVRRSACLAAGVCFVLLLGGCAVLFPQTDVLRGTWPGDLPATAHLEKVPFFPQKEYDCGPAALATVLTYFGADANMDQLIKAVYVPERHGSLQVEMLAAPRRYGMVSYRLAPRIADVLREVAAGTPVVVLQYYGMWPLSYWHYAVVVGYDREKGEVTLRSGEKPALTMPIAILEYTMEKGKYWSMVAVPPDRIPATASEPQYLESVVALERAAKPVATTAAYHTFLQRWPDNLTAEIGLANAYYKEGALKKAEAVLRRAADRHPDSVVVLNNLAQTLSDQKRNGEALQLIERAAALGGPFAATVAETRDLIKRRMTSDGAR